ncbi:DUF6663 family protein [Halapricum hydrolyticum]|uniref:Uncharacterized protein n=1 Tax=Halapricum hydrolyticum TaxID=2979991 RepID=A0AAE3I8L7_9EURY|nr:DUF6663 family protein [Halapricum hydrolyticum]MCU4716682.1 hypothetical protein [Halapricum hydrolyticum]MCU4725713.1 hypothetical protein [Halapricum hydrolyticum]
MDEELVARVLPGPDEDGDGGERTLRVFDRERYEPIDVRVGADDAADLRPGYLLDARLDWSEPARLDAFSLRRPTLYAFADGIDPVFEVAADLWRDAQAKGDGMNSSVTRNTDGEVNGVCYVFADSGAGDRFREFREGTRPLEPLVDRVNDAGSAPREAFVLRPADSAFVVVTIALEKGGHFADTLRETYDLDRPAEPLA